MQILLIGVLPLEDVLKGCFAFIISTAKYLSTWLKPRFFVRVNPSQNGKIIPSGTFQTSSKLYEPKKSIFDN